MKKPCKEMPPFAKENKGAELQWRLRNISYERMLVINEMLAEYGLHYSHPPILGMIKYCKDSTQKELADNMNTSPAAMSATLKRLQKAGYVEKMPCQEDTRINKIALTPKGERIHSDTFGKTMEIDKSMLKDFETEEIEQLFGFLERIHNNIKNR